MTLGSLKEAARSGLAARPASAADDTPSSPFIGFQDRDGDMDRTIPIEHMEPVDKVWNLSGIHINCEALTLEAMHDLDT